MIFKDEKNITEFSTEGDLIAQNTSTDDLMVEAIGDVNDLDLQETNTSIKRSLNGVKSRFHKNTYVIEPERRPKNTRKNALVAFLLVAILLTGTIFHYGSFIANPNSIRATTKNSSITRKVKSSNTEGSHLVYTGKDIRVSIKASSIEKDLSIRIIGEDGYPILGQSFMVEITFPTGEVRTLRDNEKSGRFYIDELESGEFTVAMIPLEGFITPDPVTVEVVDKVEFKVIEDISEKIVNQKEVNSAAEDPQYNNAGNKDAGTPSVVEPIKDTVEYVESKIVETTVTKYSARVDASGRLYARDGTLTDIVPVIVNGYLTENGDYTMYERPPEENSPGGEGGNVNLFEKNESGEYIYDITAHSEVKKTYYGWQDIDSKRYYFDKNGNKVTGNQVIQGHKYSFNSDGVLQTGSSSSILGVDVSTWQNYIDWKKVKASGVDFVMIRAGFRGYGSGLIVEDDLFYTNLKNAKAAGLKVGVYFFSQAINEVEGVEEASMVISLIRKYGISLDYPIAIDSEWSGAPGNTGRADNLSRAQRTAVCVAFCETVRNAGFTPMIYASKSWFESNLSTGSFGNYRIWLAHYTPNGDKSSYTGRYEMWQYTSKGIVNGISGNVDMNYSYLGY